MLQIDCKKSTGQFSIKPRLAHIIELADEDARRRNDELVSTEQIFLEIFHEQDTPSARLLQEAGLTYDRVSEAIRQRRG